MLKIMMNQFIVATILTSIFAAASAYNFNVNWVQNPKESLNAWSSRMRFQINDNLAFKSDQADSVLVVQKQDFDSCSIGNPIQKLQGGSSNFQLTRPGPYYFISGDAQNCAKGQKMMVVVLSPRTKKQPVAVSPMISPSISPSSSSMPPSLAPSFSSPSSSSMAPSFSSPFMAPSSSSMAPSSLAPIPFSTETTPGPAGGEGPALAPEATSAGTALAVTIIMAAVIVGNVLLG